MPPEMPAESGHPHNYSGKMVPMVFTQHFTFTHPDHQQEVFRAGSYDVPEEVANNWFAKAHSDDPGQMTPQPGTKEYAEHMRLANLKVSEQTFKEQRAQSERASGAARKAIEDELRPKIAAELRPQIESEVRAKIAAEDKAKPAAAADKAK